MTIAEHARTDLQGDEAPSHEHTINVGSTDRRISMLAGGALLLFGLSRRSLGGLALAGLGGGLMYRGVTGHCHCYDMLGIDTARNDIAEPEEYFERGIHIEHSVMVSKSPHELYAFWRDLNNLPRIMKHVKSVQVLDEKRSHWSATGPGGTTVEWDAEIINDEPSRLIAWRSLGGAQVDNAGSVRFVPAPGDRGTEVKVVMDYIPPAGRVGNWVAGMFGQEPGRQIAEDLRQFKSMMETGEVLTTGAQSAGMGIR
jgi:uncharacterized membrane protein